MSKRILISTGGTGGHVYPAMALAEQLSDDFNYSEILFVGGGLSDNRFFDRTAFEYRSIQCGSFVKKSPLAILKSLSKIGTGVWQSLCIIREFQPDVVVGFGSFYSFPPLVAAKMLSVPIVLHEANSIPGKVNRLLSQYVDVSAVHFPQTLKLLKGKTAEVGLPLRKGYNRLRISCADAKQHFGFAVDMPLLLVFGGSQGARAINQLICKAVFKLASSHLLQILHITGDMMMVEELKQAYTKKGISAVVKAFEERMDVAWQAADIVVSRSGASTIAEQLEFEIPGILIPFPTAADNHQEHNANFMVDTVGGATKLLEKELNADILAANLISLLPISGSKHQSMRKAMCDYKTNKRTQDLCSLVKEVIERQRS